MASMVEIVEMLQSVIPAEADGITIRISSGCGCQQSISNPHQVTGDVVGLQILVQ